MLECNLFKGLGWSKMLFFSNKTAGEEARRQLHKNAASNLEQVLAATPHKTSTVWPPASYHENNSS